MRWTFVLALAASGCVFRTQDKVRVPVDSDSDTVVGDTDVVHTDATDPNETSIADTDAPARPSVCLNELMASNDSSYELDGDFPDWIELHNPTGSTVSLAGWSVSDDAQEPLKHVLPDGLVIEAGGYLILQADDDATLGPTHLPFKLSKDGEDLVLGDPSGRFDNLPFGVQATDYSLARGVDCCQEAECLRAVFMGTPGSTNEVP